MVPKEQILNLDDDIYYSLKNIKIEEEPTCKYLPEEINWV